MVKPIRLTIPFIAVAVLSAGTLPALAQTASPSNSAPAPQTDPGIQVKPPAGPKAGVVRPPANTDPGMMVPPPQAGTTPVIPPPGTTGNIPPGNNPVLIPK
jgi:hypothetical protein